MTNSGTNSLNWSLATTSLWLNASPNSGILTPGGSTTTITASLNFAASNLVVGTYNATLWFTNLNNQLGQSRQFTLSVISPPTITTQPTNQAVLQGTPANFNVQVNGGLPLFYQWQDNGTNLTDGGNISGSTTTNLIINNVSPTNVGTYSIIVTNAAGMASSSNALLSIIPSAPVITSQPTDMAVLLGDSALFTISAIGNTPFLYQWRLNTTNVLGATNATLTLNNVQLTNAGLYSVTVSNLYGGVISSNALLTVSPFSALVVPAGLLNVEGTGASSDLNEFGREQDVYGASYFPTQTIIITGIRFRPADDSIVGNAFTNTISHIQFSLSSTPAAPDQLSSTFAANTGTNVTTVFNGALPLSSQFVGPAQGPKAFDMTVNFTTPFVYDPTSGNLLVDIQDFSDELTTSTDGQNEGNDLSSRLSAVDPNATSGNPDTSGVILEIIYTLDNQPPFIVTQPTNQTVAVGNPASFTVGASGAPPFLYQWRLNTTNVLGATNATLTLNNVQLTNAGLYSVTVSNLYGGVISSNATLTVNDVLDHFIWNQIPSPRFLNVPFTVTIQAQDSINAPFTNFIGTVNLTSTNGLAVNPHISANFIQGAWTGSLTITQATSNLTLQADDGLGHFGLANSISVVNLPALGAVPSGSFLLVFWPVAPTGFVLETTAGLSPAQWIEVTNPPLQIGDQYLQSIQMNSSNQFFRLQFPNP